MAEKYGFVDYAVLGHRVTWLLFGGELKDSYTQLNHRCGFRPCTNPGHLEIVDQQTNNMHSRMMAIAEKMVNGDIDEEYGVEELIDRSSSLPNIDKQSIRRFWDLRVTENVK